MEATRAFFIGILLGAVISLAPYAIYDNHRRTKEGCDKVLLEQNSFFVDQNFELETEVRLLNDEIKRLETENQIMGSLLTEKENNSKKVEN